MSSASPIPRISFAAIARILWEKAWNVLKALWGIYRKFMALAGKAKTWLGRAYWLLVIADASGLTAAKVLLATVDEVVEQAQRRTREFVQCLVEALVDAIHDFFAEPVRVPTLASVVRFQRRIQSQIATASSAPLLPLAA